MPLSCTNRCTGTLTRWPKLLPEGLVIRRWQFPWKATAFDTRAQGPALLTGRASKSILAKLRKAGFDLISEPESFPVTSAPELSPGEIERARLWGEFLAAETSLLT